MRETRISTLLAHVLMALSVFMMPIPLQFIPRAVLNGLFLIMAITALDHIQFFERIMLIFTEQVRYKKLFSVMLYPPHDVTYDHIWSKILQELTKISV